jgi:hypothetical protein
MSLPEPSFHDVDPMLRHLEAAIDSNTATPQLLAAMQKRLDAIDDRHRADPVVVSQYHKLLELQALIHGTHNNDAEAKKFLVGAIKTAGGVHKLSSRLLKKYIADQQAAAQSALKTPTTAQVPSTPAARAKRFPKIRRKRLFAIAGIAVLLLSAATLFGPMGKVVSAIYPSEQHAQIKRQQAEMESLTAQYNACSTELKSRAPKVDTTDPEAVDKYNKDLATCDAVRIKQNSAVDKYNALINPSKPA